MYIQTSPVLTFPMSLSLTITVLVCVCVTFVPLLSNFSLPLYTYFCVYYYDLSFQTTAFMYVYIIVC